MTWDLFWYYRSDLHYDRLERFAFDDVVFLNFALPVLVHERTQRQIVPPVVSPAPDVPDDWNLELVGQSNNVLITFLSEAHTIPKDEIKLDEDLGECPLHQISYVLISASNGLWLLAFLILLVQRIKIDPFITLNRRNPRVIVAQDQNGIIEIDILVKVLMQELWGFVHFIGKGLIFDVFLQGQ